YAANGRRIEGHTGCAQSTVEEDLREQTAVRVPDQNGRFGQRADLRLIVIHNLADCQRGESIARVAAELGNRHVLLGPGGRERLKSARFESTTEKLPCGRREPCPVNEHDGRGHDGLPSRQIASDVPLPTSPPKKRDKKRDKKLTRELHVFSCQS